MSPNPQHGTPAGDAIIAIRGLARQTGADVQELMTLYALEGLLVRIARSEHREDFVLKGRRSARRVRRASPYEGHRPPSHQTHR